MYMDCKIGTHVMYRLLQKNLKIRPGWITEWHPAKTPDNRRYEGGDSAKT